MVPGSGRSPRVGNCTLFQYPCLGNPMDRGAWWGCKRVGYHLAMKQQQQLGDNPFLLFVSFFFVRRLKIVPVSQVLCTNVNVNLQQNPFRRPSGTAFTSLPPSLSDYSTQRSPDMVQFPTSISEPPSCPICSSAGSFSCLWPQNPLISHMRLSCAFTSFMSQLKQGLSDKLLVGQLTVNFK